MANMTVFTSGGVQYAVKDAGSVHHSEAQQLSDAAKAQARANIDAADAAKLAALSDYVTSMSPLATVGPAAIAGADKAAPLPAEALSVSLAPVQEGEGTPSPENVRPIHGWTGARIDRTGVNLWDEEWETGNINPNTGMDQNSSTCIRSIGYTLIKPNTQYYFHVGSPNGANWKSRFYDIDENYIGTGGTLQNNTMFTTPSNAYFMRFACQEAYGTVYKHDISINYPPTDTEYHAYSGEIYDIDFPTEAGTVYGGTLDVTTGELIVDRTIATLVWGNGYSETEIESVTRKIFTLSQPVDANNKSKAICDMAPLNPNAWNDGIVHFSVGGNQNNQAFVWLPTETSNTQAIMICYPMETPITYQLTPQEIILLRGGNAVFADAGDVTLSYRKDVALLLESLLAGQS